MAEEQTYRFDVEARVQDALDNLNKVAKLMETIERLKEKGKADNFTTNQKDMDKNMRTMKQLVREYHALDKELEQLSTHFRERAREIGKSIPKNASRAEIERIREQRKEYLDYAKIVKEQSKSIRDQYNKTLGSFREMSNYQQNYSKNFKHVFSSNDVRNFGNRVDRAAARRVVESMLNDTDGSKLADINEQIKSVNRLNRRAESISRRGAAARYLSTQQAASFKKDYNTVNTQYTSDLEKNIEAMVSLGQRRGNLHEQVKRIERNPQASEADIEKKIALQREIEQIDKEWDARTELNRALQAAINNMQKYNAALQGVEQKPERGTFRGMTYERAPAIGLALTGAVTGAVMGLYNKGAGLSREMRPDEIALGQWTGTQGTQWREDIRNHALESGLQDKLGLSGQEMLGFETNYVSNNGFTNMKDMNSAMMNQAIFSRVTGLGSNEVKDFFSSMFQTGAVKGTQVKDIQEGIIGALKRNGMEGREKEQVKSLQSLVQNVAQGRTLSHSDISNIMGLQSLLESTGKRSLQGQQGADLLSGMNQGIRQGIQDPRVRLIMGQGTKYQGLAGRFALRKQLDKGISDVDNVKQFAAFAESYGGNNKAAQNEAFASAVQELLGTNITGEQSQAIMDLYRSGKLSKSSIDKVLNADKTTGRKESAKKLKNYQESNAATDNQSDATTQKQAAELYDMGEAIRKANAALGGIPPAAYALITALGALTAAMAYSGISFLGSRGVRMLSSGKFRNGPRAEATSAGLGTKLKNFFKGKGFNGGPPPVGGGGGKPNVPPTAGGGGPDVPPGYTRTPNGIFVPNKGTGAAGAAGAAEAKGAGSGFKSAASTAAEQGRAGYQIANGAQNVAEATGSTSTLGKIFGTGGRILNKVMLPVAIAGGAYSVATADKDHKGEATGKAAGSILGGLGGATAMAGTGAAVGSAIGSVVPVGGTIVGGLVGGAIGLAGSFIGSHIGGGIGGWIGKQFDPKKAEAAELPKSEVNGQKTEGQKEINKQIDKNTTDTKYRTEYKKTDNLQYERQNLHMQGRQLTLIQNLLLQARQQNGIIGTLTGVGDAGGGDAGSEADGGAATTNAKGRKATIWNHFAKQGYSANAISGILGNIGTETGGTFDPKTHQKGGPGIGLAQWTNTGRWRALKAYAKKRGMNPYSMQAQLSFMSYEMKKMGLTPEKMNHLSVKQATALFERKYEAAGKPNMPSRYKYAEQAKAQFGNKPSMAQMTYSGKKGNHTSSHSVKADINVHLHGNKDVVSQIGNSSALKNIGKQIQQMIFGTQNYYSKEMKMT